MKFLSRWKSLSWLKNKLLMDSAMDFAIRAKIEGLFFFIILDFIRTKLWVSKNFVNCVIA
jgi:hypothetical protein